MRKILPNQKQNPIANRGRGHWDKAMLYLSDNEI